MDGLFLILERYPDCDHGSPSLTGHDRHTAFAHHFQPLPDVIQRCMGLALVRGIKAGAVVFHDDRCAGICFSRPDGYGQRARIGISAVLNGVFNDRLQGKRRHAEEGMRRIVFDDEAFCILGLFHGEVCAGVIQLRGKRNGGIAGHGGEVLAQVGGEIHDDLLGLLRVLTAEAIDARHGVVDEVRAHLQHHDAGALVGDFLLLGGDFSLVAQIPLSLIGQNETVHGQGKDHNAGVDQRKNFHEELYMHCECYRKQSNEKVQVDFPG